jgi:DNA primase catalytic core
MARIAESEIERLKTDVSLLTLIEQSGLTPTRQGKDWAVCCPFHEDATPSLVVTPSKNLFRCFGCGASGGPIDWVMKKNGVSFRHAVELLREGLPVITDETVKRSTVRALPPPVDIDADDRALLGQVVDYYHQTLKQSPDALAYLAARGLDHPELVERFRLGYANRTLGLRLPEKTRRAGAEIRARLERLGVYRESGHEHFNGSLIVPVMDADGTVTEIYGRKLLDNLRRGTPKHLYLPGPHRGVWNGAALSESREVILCEALIDAMTFWCAGYRNVTAAYGAEGFTDEMLAAFKGAGVERVLIAYDRDEAGDRAALRLAERLMAEGFGVWRILFPKGMDANDYALKVTPASKSLGMLIRKATWLGNGAAPVREVVPPPSSLAASSAPADPPPEEPLPPPVLPAAALPEGAAEIEAAVTETEVALSFGDRRYRVRGLGKNLAYDILKVNLLASRNDAFHVDTFDLYHARARAGYITHAALELGLAEEVVKSDLGRVLLKLEQLQETAIKAALEPKAPEPVQLDEAERQAALTLLNAPDLMGRILADFEACGTVGEATNKLVAYLAATSRKLESPLAVVVQSSSAAGKTSLMDAVLAMMPPEETVRYSAMTGQSLFYMGNTNLKHKVLAIAEEAGASRASYALKLLQSEGELTIASTGSDANGNLTAQEYRVEGPMSLFTTTTAIDVDEELLNRCLILSVDEDREQTRAIHRRQREKRTLAGLVKREGKQAVQAVHHNAQRLLRPLAVVNPYADRLTFLDDRTRTRRDHEKYLTLIDAIALLHQYQRPVRSAAVGDRAVEYIEATLDDIATANRLAHEVLGRSLDELPPQTRRVLDGVRAHVRGRAASEVVPVSAVRFTRKEIRDVTGWGDTQLKIHLARLADLEYLLVHRQGTSFAYELLYDGDGKGAHLSGLIDVAALSRYDGERSGQMAERSGAGRAEVGGRSGDGRKGATPGWPPVTSPNDDIVPETHPQPPNGKILSYPHPVAI